MSPNTTGSFGLLLNNEDLVAMGQIRFRYNPSPGFQIIGVSLGSRATGYEEPDFRSSILASGEIEVSVVLYSLHGAAIVPGKGDILMFDYQSFPAFSRTSVLQFDREKTALSDVKGNLLSTEFQDGGVTSASSVSNLSTSEVGDLVTSVPVSEPSTLIFFGLGLLGLLGLCRPKKRL
ncbi:MAG: PEP-CTERM sorting domain-containing protein [bacterium]|nr:PEP-CTERM sorting domain-containing protein [bacterium]